MKKKKENKIERKPKFNNFQITWNDCNSEGEVEEEEESAQVAFMAIRDEEVTQCISQTNSDSESDDDVNSFLEKMHNSLKESYVKNKELKQKISFLIQDNANLFRQNKCLKHENDNLKRTETDVLAELYKKKNYCDLLNSEQCSLRKRMDDLCKLLHHVKQNHLQKIDTVPYVNTHRIRLNQNTNEFAIHRRRQVRFIKPVHLINPISICNFCYQSGHMYSNCHVKKNMRNEMRCMWIVKHKTNSQGPNM